MDMPCHKIVCSQGGTSVIVLDASDLISSGLSGLTVVISPLIALMKDQVDGLKKRGVAAASLDSSLSVEETRAVKDSIRDTTLKILCVAPER